MEPRPSKLATIEDWKQRNERLIQPGALDAQIIEQIKNDSYTSPAERTVIVSNWNARPEQVAASKRKEMRSKIFMYILFAITLALIVWWALLGFPIGMNSFH